MSLSKCVSRKMFSLLLRNESDIPWKRKWHYSFGISLLTSIILTSQFVNYNLRSLDPFVVDKKSNDKILEYLCMKKKSFAFCFHHRLYEARKLNMKNRFRDAMNSFSGMTNFLKWWNNKWLFLLKCRSNGSHS